MTCIIWRRCRRCLEDHRWRSQVETHLRHDGRHRHLDGAIAVSESDPNVIYVGTGEACIRGNIVGGNGVYKSIDAGATWKFVGLPDTRAIGSLIVNPRNPDIAFVAALGHPFADNEERGIVGDVVGWRTTCSPSVPARPASSCRRSRDAAFSLPPRRGARARWGRRAREPTLPPSRSSRRGSPGAPGFPVPSSVSPRGSRRASQSRSRQRSSPSRSRAASPGSRRGAGRRMARSSRAARACTPSPRAWRRSRSQRKKVAAVSRCSSVAPGTIRRRVHVVRRLDLAPYLTLSARRRRPLHVGHLLRRAQVRRRVSVAVQAPSHRERFGFMSTWPMRSTRPWQLTQPTPFATWIE